MRKGLKGLRFTSKRRSSGLTVVSLIYLTWRPMARVAEFVRIRSTHELQRSSTKYSLIRLCGECVNAGGSLNLNCIPHIVGRSFREQLQEFVGGKFAGHVRAFKEAIRQTAFVLVKFDDLLLNGSARNQAIDGDGA